MDEVIIRHRMLQQAATIWGGYRGKKVSLKEMQEIFYHVTAACILLQF